MLRAFEKLAPGDIIIQDAANNTFACVRTLRARGEDTQYCEWTSGEVELYDLAAGLGERRSLAGARPAAAAELRRALTAWLREVGAERPRTYAEIPAGELPGKKRR